MRVEDEISFVEGVGFPKAGDGIVRWQGHSSLYNTVLRAKERSGPTSGAVQDFRGLHIQYLRVIARKLIHN